MEKNFIPENIEKDMYKKWEDSGYFKCKIDKTKKPFTIVMPPPNITGKLHMGHALDQTVQDIFIRYNRMKGIPTLWIPGTDHASIATEAKVVDKLRKENITKDMLGRENFLDEVWKWKEEYGDEIKNQIRRLGSSCDFEKERFTMDDMCSEAVKESFIKLYNDGYIYRGNRIVNWCPHCKTSISDTEVNYLENKGMLYYVRYKFEDSNEYLVIATTRPETIFGDTAICVNPKDTRYTKYINKKVIVPLTNRKVTVISDIYVDMEFGTGALKITPAHDINDYNIGIKYNLDSINILNDDGTLNEKTGKYVNQDRFVARENIVKELNENSLIEKIEDYTNNVGSCYRCNTVIEPYLSLQWFVKMDELVKPAIESVKLGNIKFIPKRFEKTYFNWMENIQDWCISRQLWWGHQIPAYYCDKCDKITVSKDKVTKCSCGGNLTQDDDSLDTWYSSALWSFSTLGWPNNTEELQYFHPTSLLVTGYDIITFWVSKMIFSSLHYLNEIPFENVYIHGIVRDSNGKKMSKSLGNGVDPLDIIEKYGTDALRFSLIQNTSPGNDVRYIPEKLESSKNFVNKIWNAAKFINNYLDKYEISENFKIEDKWIITKLNSVILEVEKNIKNFEIGIALNNIYDFIWNNFCDEYIEMVKPRLYNNNDSTAIYTLNYVYTEAMKLLHPYMPYVTEEISKNLKVDFESIMISNYPTIKYTFNDEYILVDQTLELIKKIRNYRKENDISNKVLVDMDVVIKDKKYLEIFNESTSYIKKLCGISNIKYLDETNKNNTLFNFKIFDAYIDFNSVVDKNKIDIKINNEILLAKKELSRAQNMLNNKSFIDKAPKELILKEEEKIKKYTEILNKLIK
ncbi:MAG: valine--tRNA ligase [Clostridia bacterium]